MLSGIVSDSLTTGLPYSLAFLGVWMTFRLQGQFDISIDNMFALGAAVFGTWAIHGHNPVVGVLLATCAGAVAGAAMYAVMRLLGLTLLLASIIVGTGLYSLNLLIMGAPDLNLFSSGDIFQSWANTFAGGDFNAGVMELAGLLAIVVFMGLIVFLRTEFGLQLRASGLNPKMVISNAASPAVMLFLSIVVGDALVTTSGALIAQQGGFSDVQMGIGTLVSAITAILIGEVVTGQSGATWRGVLAVPVGALLYRAAISLAFRLGLNPTYFEGITALIVFLLLGLRRAGGRVSFDLGTARARLQPRARSRPDALPPAPGQPPTIGEHER